MRLARVALSVLGAGILLWGTWLLGSTQRLDQLLSVAVWLAAAVILHDVVLVPALSLARRYGAQRRSHRASTRAAAARTSGHRGSSSRRR